MVPCFPKPLTKVHTASHLRIPWSYVSYNCALFPKAPYKSTYGVTPQNTVIIRLFQLCLVSQSPLQKYIRRHTSEYRDHTSAAIVPCFPKPLTKALTTSHLRIPWSYVCYNCALFPKVPYKSTYGLTPQNTVIIRLLQLCLVSQSPLQKHIRRHTSEYRDHTSAAIVPCFPKSLTKVHTASHLRIPWTYVCCNCALFPKAPYKSTYDVTPQNTVIIRLL